MAKAKYPTTWLIYPRRDFIICRALQVFISLIFLIVNLAIEWEHARLWTPLNSITFIVYSATLIAYICNPTRLSRVLDPHNEKSRVPISPLPNKPNLSGRGVTLTIVIIEFLLVFFCLIMFILGIYFPAANSDWCVGVQTGMEGLFLTNPQRSSIDCKIWWVTNLGFGTAMLAALGMATFWQGVKVYRTGSSYRESGKREGEMETSETPEIMSNMGELEALEALGIMSNGRELEAPGTRGIMRNVGELDSRGVVELGDGREWVAELGSLGSVRG